MAIFPSCQSSDEPETESATPEIIFMFSPGGLGDLSYNDCILEGVQRFRMSRPDIDIYICSPDSPFLAGMDIDQSGLSNKIVGSVIKEIDNLVFEYLTEWADTGTMPETGIYGLESGYADWQFSPSYEEYSDAVEQYRQQAITMENEYYAGN